MQSPLKITSVDVSKLAPPEPMTVILKHLAKLAHYECLLVKHRRQPFPLYEKLNGAGFSYYCVEHTQNKVELYIYHKTAQNSFDKTLINTYTDKGDN